MLYGATSLSDFFFQTISDDRQIRTSSPFRLSFQYFSSDITSYFHGFSHRPALSHKTRDIIRSGKIDSLRQFFHVNIDDLLHSSFFLLASPCTGVVLIMKTTK
jgi:hypothetical protein